MIRIVVLCLVLFSSAVFAGRTINTATVDGGSSTDVALGASVTVALNVTTSGTNNNNNWRSISYTLNASTVCLSEPNITSAGTYNHSFTITAPNTVGSFSLAVSIHKNDSCGNGGTNTYGGSLTINTSDSGLYCDDIWPADATQTPTGEPVMAFSPESFSSNALTISSDLVIDAAFLSSYYDATNNAYIFSELTIEDGVNVTFADDVGTSLVIYVGEMEVGVGASINADNNTYLAIIAEEEIEFDEQATGYGLFYSFEEVELDGSGVDQATIVGAVSAKDTLDNAGADITYDSNYIANTGFGSACNNTNLNPPGQVCPNPGSNVAKVNINEIHIKNGENWIELFIAPNASVDLQGWKITSKGQGNIDDTFTICSTSCIYTAGANGLYLIYGQDAFNPNPSYFIENASFDVHNTWNELLLEDDDGLLVHYLRYGNNGNGPDFDYADCDAQYSTTVLDPGSGESICTSTDGLIRSDQDNDGNDWDTWQQECSPSAGGTNATTPTPVVDHYRIIHSATSLTCQAPPVTVMACSDASCTDTNAMIAVTADLQLTNGSGTSTLANIDFSTGSYSSTFTNANEETVTLSLANLSETQPVSCYLSDNSASSCQVAFANSGFLVSAADFVSSANNSSSVTIQAVKSTDNNQTCAPDFSGDKLVNIDFSYLQPATNVVNQPLQVSIDNSSFTAVTSGNAISRLLNFSVGQSLATFYIKYAEVGELLISVADGAASPVLQLGTDNVNVIPAQMVLTLDDGVANLGATGNETHLAAQPFNLTIQAVNAEGVVTQNYQPGSLQFQPVMTAPLTSAGASLVNFYYAPTTPMVISNATTWQNAQTLTFTGSGYSTNVASIDDIGSFTVDVRDNNYLGYVVTSAASSSAGRFTPAYFAIEEVVALTVGATHTSGTADFSYIGESLSVTPNAQYRYVAKNYKNSTANNYGGSFNQFSSGFGLANRSYVETNSNTAISGSFVVESLGSVTVTDTTAFDGQFEYDFSDQFSYSKPITPIAPFISNLDLTVPQASITDDDGIGYDSNGINNDLPVYEDWVLSGITSAENRFARLSFTDIYGPDDANLKIPAYVEYWDGSRFITNTDDNDTDFASLTATVVNTSGGSAFSLVTVNSGGDNFYQGETRTLDGFFINALTPTEIAELLVTFTNLPTHLQFDWNDDGSLNNDDRPQVSVSFGRNQGNDRIIYKRER